MDFMKFHTGFCQNASTLQSWLKPNKNKSHRTWKSTCVFKRIFSGIQSAQNKRCWNKTKLAKYKMEHKVFRTNVAKTILNTINV